MSTFVLVPGAWLGSWAWQPVAEGLRALGHTAIPVTLAGLAERADEPVEKIGLATHVADVHAAIEGLRGVVLVGHSYSGIVTGQVAAAAWPDAIARAIFIDSNVPVDGRSFVDGFSARGQEIVHEQIAASDGYWPVPDPDEFDGHELSPEQIASLLARSTPHPGQTLLDPATLVRPLSSLAAATYVHCPKPELWQSPDVEALRSAPGWSFTTLETGHWPMVSAPAALTALLHEIASS